MMMSSETQFHVLAVDDSIIDRKLIERLLINTSYQVTVVESAVKALQFLGLLHDDQISHHKTIKSDVNLIITDYSMPAITGYDLLRKLKESRSFKDIPVVIMSSENIPSRISSCLENGAEEFFLKPIRQCDVNKLRTHLVKPSINKRKRDDAPEWNRRRCSDSNQEQVDK